MSLLLADQDFNQRIVTHLIKLGHHVVNPVDMGWANVRVDDRDVLDAAIKQRRAVLTHNGWDFKKLHAERKNLGQPPHCGLIVCSQVPRGSEQSIAQKIDQAIIASTRLDGAVLRVHLNGFSLSR